MHPPRSLMSKSLGQSPSGPDKAEVSLSPLKTEENLERLKRERYFIFKKGTFGKGSAK